MEFRLDRRDFLSSFTAAKLLERCAAGAGLRVASLDWALAETMIALGETPIAIVAASDWNRFVVEPPLPTGVVDLGLQQEINFELLASLKPDLILTSPFMQDADASLRKIGKTLSLSIFEKGKEPLAQPRFLTRALGERLGCVEASRAFLAGAERLLDSYRARIAAIAPLPVLLVNFIDARHVRVYGGAGLYQNVLDRIGVTNAWPGQTNYWGYATVGIEKLATRSDLRLFTFEPIPFDARKTLEQSPLWTRLPFVEAGHVSELPTVFMFGAMPSALRFARLLVEKLETLKR
jgi:ferric hydroxamate transport system substrate-binding protein